MGLKKTTYTSPVATYIESINLTISTSLKPCQFGTDFRYVVDILQQET